MRDACISLPMFFKLACFVHRILYQPDVICKCVSTHVYNCSRCRLRVNELAAAYLEKQSTRTQAAGSSRAGKQESLKAPTSLDRPHCSWQRQVGNFDMHGLV